MIIRNDNAHAQIDNPISSNNNVHCRFVKMLFYKSDSNCCNPVPAVNNDNDGINNPD